MIEFTDKQVTALVKDVHRYFNEGYKYFNFHTPQQLEAYRLLEAEAQQELLQATEELKYEEFGQKVVDLWHHTQRPSYFLDLICDNLENYHVGGQFCNYLWDLHKKEVKCANCGNEVYLLPSQTHPCANCGETITF